MTKASVDSIGQGRVWAATDAKKLGLVDLLGGIDKAIEIAANKAKLKTYRIVELPKQEDALTSILKDFSTKIRNNIVHSELGSETSVYLNIKEALNRRGIFARMPFEITVY